MNQRAVFLDNDGTLVKKISYNVDPDQVKLTDGSLGGLKLLQDAGYKLIIVANQAGVAHGKYREEDIQPMIERIHALVGEAGITLDGFYYCPHHPYGKLKQYTQACFCRKPNPGLIFQAAREHDINLGESWMIGDVLDDIEAGHRTDCRTLLISNGSETEWRLTTNRRPNFNAGSLLQAAEIILSEQDRPRAQVVSHSILRRLYPAQHSSSRL